MREGNNVLKHGKGKPSAAAPQVSSGVRENALPGQQKKKVHGCITVIWIMLGITMALAMLLACCDPGVLGGG